MSFYNVPERHIAISNHIYSLRQLTLYKPIHLTDFAHHSLLSHRLSHRPHRSVHPRRHCTCTRPVASRGTPPTRFQWPFPRLEPVRDGSRSALCRSLAGTLSDMETCSGSPRPGSGRVGTVSVRATTTLTRRVDQKPAAGRGQVKAVTTYVLM